MIVNEFHPEVVGLLQHIHTDHGGQGLLCEAHSHGRPGFDRSEAAALGEIILHDLTDVAVAVVAVENGQLIKGDVQVVQRG